MSNRLTHGSEPGTDTNGFTSFPNEDGIKDFLSQKIKTALTGVDTMKCEEESFGFIQRNLDRV